MLKIFIIASVATKCIPKNGVCDLLVDWRDFESVCYSIPSRDNKNFISFLPFLAHFVCGYIRMYPHICTNAHVSHVLHVAASEWPSLIPPKTMIAIHLTENMTSTDKESFMSGSILGSWMTERKSTSYYWQLTLRHIGKFAFPLNWCHSESPEFLSISQFFSPASHIEYFRKKQKRNSELTKTRPGENSPNSK